MVVLGTRRVVVAASQRKDIPISKATLSLRVKTATLSFCKSFEPHAEPNPPKLTRRKPRHKKFRLAKKNLSETAQQHKPQTHTKEENDMSRAVSPAPSVQSSFAELFLMKPSPSPSSPLIVEEIPTIEILPHHTPPTTPLSKRGPCKHEPVSLFTPPAAAILLPRSRLGTVSYRPHGSNLEISANIINMRTQLQRRDTGQIYNGVKEFHDSLDIEYGPGAAVDDLSPRSPKTRSAPNELPPISSQKPLTRLKCGTKLEHSDVWL